MISSNHTTELDKILVKRLWANEECPYFDLIMHENGKVFPLLMVSKDDSGICVMKSDSWTPISEVQNLEDENKLNEGFAAIFSKDFSEMDLRVSCGGVLFVRRKWIYFTFAFVFGRSDLAGFFC
jgi:hypothetical protein